jgi:hypothetical protein
MTKPLYFYNGTTFEQVGPTTPQSPIAYQTSAPTGPATGDLWIDSDGDVDTYNRQLTRYYFVATAAQTTISGVDANSLTLAYVAGSEAVYVNGALQVRGQDYTASNGTSVVMSSGLAVNDVVEIFAYTAFTVANAYTKSETDGLVGTAAGLKLLTPTSVAVGSGSGSVTSTGTVTFSSASSVSLNGVFSSTYENYRIVFTTSNFSASDALSFRLRASGSDYSSANYSISGTRNYSNTATISALNASSQTSIAMGSTNSGAGDRCGITIDIFKPFTNYTNKVMHITVAGQDTSGFYNRHQVGLADGGTYIFDGFTFIIASGNMTGTVSVYGLKN